MSTYQPSDPSSHHKIPFHEYVLLHQMIPASEAGTAICTISILILYYRTI